MKKIITLILAGFMIISLSACGNSEKSGAKAKNDYTIEEFEKKLNEQIKAYNDNAEDGAQVETVKFDDSILKIKNAYTYTSDDSSIMINISYEEKDGSNLISGIDLTADADEQSSLSYSVYQHSIISLLQPDLSNTEIDTLKDDLLPFDGDNPKDKEIEKGNITYSASADVDDNSFTFSVLIFNGAEIPEE